MTAAGLRTRMFTPSAPVLTLPHVGFDGDTYKRKDLLWTPDLGQGALSLTAPEVPRCAFKRLW